MTVKDKIKENKTRRPMMRPVDASKYIGLSTSCLAKLRLTKGLGPEYIKLGKVVVYDPNDLDIWIDSKRQGKIK